MIPKTDMPPTANFDDIETFSDCTSKMESSSTTALYLLNIIIWVILLVCTLGIVLIPFFLFHMLSRIFSEYSVRMIQVHGCTVSSKQYPQIYEAMQDVQERFNFQKECQIIIVPSGEFNAMSISFAKKHVIILLSEVVESLVESPEQMRFLLAHELCHIGLSYSFKDKIFLYSTPGFKQGRELTCDNAGLVAADSLEHGKAVLKKLCVGKKLYKYINESELVQDSKRIFKGLTGWFVKQYLTHPPVGTRMLNLVEFYKKYT